MATSTSTSAAAAIPAAAHCSHCQLPLGRLGLQREVGGEPHAFCCYGCCLAFQVSHGEHDEPEAAALLIRLGVGAFLAMFIMLFSLLQYSGSLAGEAWLGRLVDALLWLLATPLLVVLGAPFFGGAWQAARAGRLTADSLVSVGVLGAYGYSVWQVLRGSGGVYFDTAAMVLMLFTLGRYLEAQARVRAARSLAPMLAAERAMVRVRGEGEGSAAGGVGGGAGSGEVLRPVAEVAVGEVVRVLPGERIGVDGVVLDGYSACDESVRSGQPAPQWKAPGAQVWAGSVNGAGQLLVRATVAGRATHWVHMGRLVREALARKSALGETVDRVAAAFVPAVLLLAAATAWYWSGRAGMEAALLAGISVLVVACPCALGLAAPLAGVLGIGEAAQRGILVRGGVVLERLARVRALAFDKTGTLTRGELRPLAFAVEGASVREVLRRAAALAAGSDHPVARAIRAHAGSAGRRAGVVHALQAQAGAGIGGEVAGEYCALGSQAFMTAQGWATPPALAPAALPAGKAAWIGWGGRVRGAAVFADPLRPEAAVVVAALRRQGLPSLLLSGDGEAAVAALGRRLGLAAWQGGLLPEAKVAALRRWQALHGPLAMVGDGLNDGPVLAAATVGIAVGGASDLARESADVVLPRGGLAQLPELFVLARAVQASVRANLCWAFGYNLVALALAAAGLLQPVLAAALMAGSSLVVVVRTLRARRRARPGGEAIDPAIEYRMPSSPRKRGAGPSTAGGDSRLHEHELICCRVHANAAATAAGGARSRP